MSIKKKLTFLIMFQVFTLVCSQDDQSVQPSSTPVNRNKDTSLVIVEDKKDYQPIYYTSKNQNDCLDDCKMCCGSLILFFTRFNIIISI